MKAWPQEAQLMGAMWSTTGLTLAEAPGFVCGSRRMLICTRDGSPQVLMILA